MSGPRASSRLMVLMFTDLVGSVDLKTRLGNTAYVGLIARHDRIFKGIVQSIPGASVLKDTGDGFLATFPTATAGVEAALRFQWAVFQEPWEPEPLRVCVGLHVGEVVELEDSGVNPKLVGLAADFAARIMGLAEPGQVLLTRTVFDDARQYLREHPPVDAGERPELKWMAHGPYLFKGGEEPVNVFEVGAVDVAPLREPGDSEKARRAVTPGEEDLFGWRPAIGAQVPGRDHWLLEKKLGEGGFGEVWLARHQRIKSARVFKFCYDADRLRSFKRELTLFRLLREALGDRHDIVTLHEVRLDEPPYFLESEYSEQGDLGEWADRQGGIAEVPLKARLRLVSQTAEAVAAAHSIGILHKDIKPSNILIKDEEGGPRACLADFGIGVLADRSALEERDITVAGFTETLMGNDSSRTGTRVYAPPESLMGRTYTIQGDVYALGVVLYQMVIGDLDRPLAQEWQAGVDDEILREDIEACVHGDTAARLGSAAELADRLKNLDARRLQRRRERDERDVAQERARLLKTRAVALVVLLVLLVVAASLFGIEYKRRNEKEQALDREASLRVHAQKMEQVANEQRTEAERLYTGVRELAGDFLFNLDDMLVEIAGTTRVRERLMTEVIKHLDGLATHGDASQIRTKRVHGYRRVAEIMGDPYFSHLGHYDEALRAARKAFGIQEKIVEQGPDNPQARVDLAEVHRLIGDITFGQGMRKGANAGAGPALPHYLAAEKILARLDPGHVEVQKGQAVVYDRIADMQMRLGRVEAGLENYERTLTLAKAILARDPSPRSRNRLLIAYSKIGDVHKRRRHFEEALDQYRLSEKIAKDLVKDRPSARHRRNLAFVQTNIAVTYRGMNRRTDSLAYHRLSLDTRRQLFESDANNRQALSDYLRSLDSVAGILYGMRRYGEALPIRVTYRELCRQRLEREPGVPENLASYSYSVRSLADTQMASLRDATALRSYGEFLDLATRYLTGKPCPEREKAWIKANEHLLSVARIWASSRSRPKQGRLEILAAVRRLLQKARKDLLALSGGGELLQRAAGRSREILERCDQFIEKTRRTPD